MNSTESVQSVDQTHVISINSYHGDRMGTNGGFSDHSDVCTTNKSELLDIASLLVLPQLPRLLLINI